MKKLRLSLVSLASILLSCANIESYKITDTNRNPITAATNLQDFYQTLDISQVSQEEAKYIENFRKQNKPPQEQLLNDPIIREMDFMNREAPSTRDLVFLCHFEKYFCKNSSIFGFFEN